MTFDYTKAVFGSDQQIDKIQVWATGTDSSANLNGAIAYSTVVPADPTPGVGPTLAIGTINNPYGKKGLVSLIWSLDNTNWYPQNAIITYYNATNAEWLWQMNVLAGCDDTTIYFIFATEYTADQTVYFQFAVDRP